MSSFDLAPFVALFKGDRKMVVAMATMAESAERYEDMCAFMKHLVQMSCDSGGALTVEERNLFSVAYKNVIGNKRAAWRTLITLKDEATSLENLDAYTKKVEEQLASTCMEVLDLLKKLVDTAEDDVEGNVFYLKMAGDYYRYLAEAVPGDDYPIQASEYYKKAYAAATAKGPDGQDLLVPTHPIRLGLALNYSVCYYEILKDQKGACELAKKAFDDAIAKLDKLGENEYKDSTLIMQLLRDNLTLWSSNGEDNDNVQVEDLSDEEN